MSGWSQTDRGKNIKKNPKPFHVDPYKRNTLQVAITLIAAILLPSLSDSSAAVVRSIHELCSKMSSCRYHLFFFHHIGDFLNFKVFHKDFFLYLTMFLDTIVDQWEHNNQFVRMFLFQKQCKIDNAVYLLHADIINSWHNSDYLII